ncbi:MAG: hypothetical protein IJ532_00920 [Alphaproteobacteria bacterium]|nr:hypothetical protein [Alphaproteobacteria bacterium]
MKQMKVLRGNIVTLVTIPKYLPVIMRPSIGEYDNPYVMKTTPCECVDGEYYDLHTGAKVVKKDNMLEWKNLSGTVFRYKNKHNFPEECLLISKRYEDGKLLLLSVEQSEITTCMIPRVVRDRQVQDDY